jgi:hypothetical protein
MKRFPLLLTLAVLASCAASGPRPAEPWRVEVATSGGIAGRGMGTYAVSSDGKADVTLTNGRSCSFALTADELRRTADVLRGARPAEWKASYVPENSCCDRFEYDLTLDEAGAVTKTKWIDDPLPRPADLEALADAIVGGEWSIRTLATERCK